MRPELTYRLLETFRELFERKVFRHRSSNQGDKVAIQFFEDLSAAMATRCAVSRLKFLTSSSRFLCLFPDARCAVSFRQLPKILSWRMLSPNVPVYASCRIRRPSSEPSPRCRPRVRPVRNDGRRALCS